MFAAVLAALENFPTPFLYWQHDPDCSMVQPSWMKADGTKRSTAALCIATMILRMHQPCRCKTKDKQTVCDDTK